MNMNILLPPFYFHFHPLRLFFFPFTPSHFTPPPSRSFCLAFYTFTISLVLQPLVFISPTSFPVSRSPGTGRYSSPPPPRHLLNTLLFLLPFMTGAANLPFLYFTRFLSVLAH
jgi:hypothetical protein